MVTEARTPNEIPDRDPLREAAAATADHLAVTTERILDRALESMRRAHLEHYQEAGVEDTRQRLRTLYDLTRQSVSTKNVSPMVRFAEELAAARFSAGFDLREVQTAFNVLEEVIWNELMDKLPPAEVGHALGLIGTVLGAGKDALARRYVSLATNAKAPSLNLSRLFSGTDGV